MRHKLSLVHIRRDLAWHCGGLSSQHVCRCVHRCCKITHQGKDRQILLSYFCLLYKVLTGVPNKPSFFQCIVCGDIMLSSLGGRLDESTFSFFLSSSASGRGFWV